METLAGWVRGDGVVVGFATISAPGFTREGYYAHREFELELEDGSTVSVHLDPTRLQLSWPKDDKTAEWSSFADDPRCAPFVDDAPPPHVRVQLSWSEIRGGNRIRVQGEHERTFADASSHRAAPESSTSFVAHEISEVPPQPKPPPAPREWSILAALCALIAIAGFVFWGIGAPRNAAIGGLVYLSAAVWYAYSKSKPGGFFTRAGPVDATFPNTIFWELAALTVGGGIVYGIIDADPGAIEPEDAWFALSILFVLMGLACVRVFIHRHRTARLLRIALGTPRGDAGFRSVEGMLMTDLTCTQKLISIDGAGDDISYEHQYSTNLTSSRRIVVRTAQGDVRVPLEVTWFTAARVRERPPPMDPDSKRDVEAKTLWQASEGEPVLLCATIEDGRAMNRGTDSILLVANPSRARRSLWARRAIMLLMLMIVAITATLAFAQLPFLTALGL